MIVNVKYGQLSNRLIVIAHAMALAIEKHSDLLVTTFEDLKGKYACRVIWDGNVVLRSSMFWGMEKVLADVIRKVFGFRIRLPGVVSDWSYRNRSGVEKFHDDIVAFFLPKDHVISYASDFLKKYWPERVLNVGVHIRRGDYAQWMGGAYYYDDEVYISVMRSIASELGASKVRFVVFSNEPIDLSRFKDELNVIKSDGSAFDDHWLMSKCDYLVGPPSTFTIWASWYGKVPLAHIESKDHRPRISEFKWAREC